jgi:hypothetical protein
MDIRIQFGDFWPEFNKRDNFWIWILKQRHNVILDSVNPNLVITMGHKPLPDVFTVYYSNEPFFPNPETCDFDYYMSNFFVNIPNHTRFPSYLMYLCEFMRMGVLKDLSLFNQENRIIPAKTHFCAFVSKSASAKRGRFFNRLNEYKQVDTNISPYNHFGLGYDSNQFNSSIPKMDFIKKYKFNIAFENNWRGHHTCFPNANVQNGELMDMGGLISEKLIEPLIAGVIPIYWGSDMVSKEFNNNTFLNYYDFPNEDALIDKIIELDTNDELYNSYFKESINGPNQNNVITIDSILDIFDDVLKNIK